jgi:hypothetical protein
LATQRRRVLLLLVCELDELELQIADVERGDTVAVESWPSWMPVGSFDGCIAIRL